MNAKPVADLEGEKVLLVAQCRQQGLWNSLEARVYRRYWRVGPNSIEAGWHRLFSGIIEHADVSSLEEEFGVTAQWVIAFDKIEQPLATTVA